MRSDLPSLHTESRSSDKEEKESKDSHRLSRDDVKAPVSKESTRLLLLRRARRFSCGDDGWATPVTIRPYLRKKSAKVDLRENH